MSSHEQGMVDGIKLWGEVCGSQGNCDECPIGSIKGVNVTCQDFARQFPAKMLSILKEMSDEDYTYYKEYCTRFPECNMPVEVLADCVCRKAVFEGFTACESGDCVECWKEKYAGDVTEDVEDDETDLE